MTASRDKAFLCFLLVEVYARCSVDAVEQQVGILYSQQAVVWGKEGVTWVWGS